MNMVPKPVVDGIKHPLSGKIMVGIGIATVLSEVILRIVSVSTGKQYELDHWVIAVGSVIGFAGFWSINSTKTKEAVEVVTGFVPKFGRRATDPVAIPDAETKVKAIPTATAEHRAANKKKNGEGGDPVG